LGAIRHAIVRSRTDLAAKRRFVAPGLLRVTHPSRTELARVVSGLLNKQVGDELGISEITVQRERGQVTRKMKAGSLPGLVNMAAKLRLAPAPKG